MKIIVRFASLLGCAIWMAVVDFASRFSDYLSPYDVLWISCPFIYFVMIFCTSFAKRRSIQVLSTGIAGHVILAGFVLSIFSDKGATGLEFLIPSLFCSFLWTVMYLGLDHEPAA
jgi:hypothetical protein